MSKETTTTMTAEEMAELEAKIVKLAAASIRVMAALAAGEEPDPADVDAVKNQDVVSPVYMAYTPGGDE